MTVAVTGALFNFQANPNVTTTDRVIRYSSLVLTWNDITLGGQSGYSSVSVNRSRTGPPADISEGVSVVSQPADAAFVDAFSDSFGGVYGSVTNATDTGLSSGQWYYYSLFGFNGSNWIKLDETAGLVPTNYGFQNQLMSWTPGVFKNIEQEVAGQPDDSSAQLFQFYGILGFVADYTRTFVETLNDAYDVRKVAASLLPQLCDEFGITYEQEAGAGRNRALAAHAIGTWQAKGNAIGLETFTASLSGYTIQLVNNKNLLLDYNDYNFADSLKFTAGTGVTTRWKRTVSNVNNVPTWTTISAPSIKNASDTVAAISVQVTGSGSNPDVLYQYYSTAAVTATTGVAAMTEANALIAGPSQVLQNAISLSANDIYYASVYVNSTSAFRAKLSCQWFDKNGVYLSVTAGTSTTYAATGWAEQAFYPPAGAVYAMPMIFFGSTSTQTLKFTNLSFSQTGIRENTVTGMNAVPFAPNTQLLHVNPTRWNRIYSPNFQFGWSSGAGGAFAVSNTNVETQGSNVWSLAGAGTYTVSTDTTSLTYTCRVQRARQYTFSVYVNVLSGTVTQHSVSIKWYKGPNFANDLINTSSQTYTPTAGWQRLSLTAYAPTGARHATVSISSTATTAASGAYNAPLFEQAPSAQTYFGGTTSLFVGQSTDIRTANSYSNPETGTQTAYQAPTNYYRRHDTFLAGSGGTPGRIAANLDDSVTQGKNNLLPVGATYSLIEHPDVQEIGSVYWRNNLWLYDCTHSWYNGLAECWDTDDIWTDWWYDLLNRTTTHMDWADEILTTWDDMGIGLWLDLLNRPTASNDWADEISLSWDYQSVVFNADVYADLYS